MCLYHSYLQKFPGRKSTKIVLKPEDLSSLSWQMWKVCTAVSQQAPTKCRIQYSCISSTEKYKFKHLNKLMKDFGNIEGNVQMLTSKSI